MSIVSRLFASGLVVVLAVFAVSCGSNTNNDQGTSLTALGFWSYPDDTSLSGAFGALASDIPVVGSGAYEGLEYVVSLGVENRLSSETVQISRIECSYDVPGAAAGFSIPPDSAMVSTVLAGTGIPATPSITTGGGSGSSSSTAVTALAKAATSAHIAFPIVTSDLFSYLNVYRNSLPELPFRMYISCNAVGVTQAGDVLTTNPAAFTITFFDAAVCCGGTPGFQIGTGTGGTFSSSSSSSVSSAAAAGTAAATVQ